MQIVATVISTRSLGYFVDILTDGAGLFIGAFYIHGGKADFIAGTGSRDLLSTLRYIEQALNVPVSDARLADMIERDMRANVEENTYENFKLVQLLRQGSDV